MGRKNKRFAGYGLWGMFLVLLGGGVATAQDAPGSAPVDPLTGRPAAAAKSASLSPAEQLAQGKSIVSRLETTRESVRRDLEDARAKGDVVKKLCLDDKLNQIDNTIQKAGDRVKALESAVQAGDVDLANHEFTILSVLEQRRAQLDAEAKQCIGKEIQTAGQDTSTKVEIDQDFVGDANFSNMPIIAEPPSCSSCVK